MQIHAEDNDAIIKTSEDFFKKYTCHFIWKGCVCEGVRGRTKLQYIDPHSYDHQRCVFLVLQGCSTGGLGPSLLDAGFLYRILSLTHLTPTPLVSNFRSPNSIGGPKGPFCRVVAFSTRSCHQFTWSPTNWLPVFTELYNSSIAHSIFGMACLIVINLK